MSVYWKVLLILITKIYAQNIMYYLRVDEKLYVKFRHKYYIIGET